MRVPAHADHFVSCRSSVNRRVADYHR